MSVKGIIERIQHDATAEAEQIKQKYIGEVKKLEEEFEKKKEKLLAAATEKAKIERKRAYQQAIDHQKSVLAQKLLAHKQKLLEQFYDSVRKEIENFEPNRYREYFADILAKLGENSGKIIVAKDADILNDEFIAIASGKIKQKTGVEPNFELVKSDDNFRGFILDIGKIRYDVTIDAVLAQIRENSEEKVISELFG